MENLLVCRYMMHFEHVVSSSCRSLPSMLSFFH